MDVAITGSSGLIGSALADALHARGDRVIPVARGAGLGLRWDPDAGTIDAAGFEGVDAVVHLAGAGIGDKKWTPERKRRILESRIAGHRPARAHPRRPATASHRCWCRAPRSGTTATGATRGSPSECARPPDDFLAEVCQAWEAATAPAAEAGIRAVHLRTGIVLAAQGGVLGRLLLAVQARASADGSGSGAST